MAFFDDLGRTLSQVGQVTAQKTKEVADIAVINAKILEVQGRLGKAYEELGRRYAEIHGTDAEEALAAAVYGTQKLESQIEEYQRQLSDIRGMAKCALCGAENENSSVYCSSCGAAMTKEESVVDSEVIFEEVVKD